MGSDDRPNSASPLARYDFREDGEGWCVFDTCGNGIVSLQGKHQTGLGLEAADELAAALNRAAVLRSEVRSMTESGQ